jgi:hypothetical protein
VAAGGGSFPPPIFVTAAVRDGAPEFQTGFGGQATDHTSEATEMTYIDPRTRGTSEPWSVDL